MSKRFLVIGFSLLVLMGTLLACGGSRSVKTGTTINAPTQAPTHHVKIGQTVKVGDTWQIVVNSAQTSNGSEFNKPQKSGTVFLVIIVTMKNLSSQEQDVSSLTQWYLQDSTGQTYNGTFDSDAGATLDGQVEANSLLKGALAYEVPSGQKTFTLSFENDITSSGFTVWDITV